jgi:hypothetical protein
MLFLKSFSSIPRRLRDTSRVFYAKRSCHGVIIAGQVCVVNRGGFTPFSSFMNILTFLKREVI